MRWAGHMVRIKDFQRELSRPQLERDIRKAEEEDGIGQQQIYGENNSNYFFMRFLLLAWTQQAYYINSMKVSQMNGSENSMLLYRHLLMDMLLLVSLLIMHLIV